MRWDDADLDPPEQASGTSAAESRLLDKAIATVDADLDTIVRDASQRGAVGEAGIFAVHRVLLEDPTLLDAARDLISLGKSAGFAWREAIRAQIEIPSHVEDALLAETSTHLREAGGKRFRATLVLLAGQFGNPADERVVRAATAIELTHLATLYHDDVMDEALIRRGHPSANSRWTNTIAILTGGALKGGSVLADWPGLKDADLYEHRDLRATTDLSAVLKGLLRDHLGVGDQDLGKGVFPDSLTVLPMPGLLT